MIQDDPYKETQVTHCMEPDAMTATEYGFISNLEWCEREMKRINMHISKKVELCQDRHGNIYLRRVT